MPYTKSGSLFCPCCGTKITVTNEDGRLVATTRQIINDYDHITEHQEEKSPQGPGNVRPRELSTPVHESVHGQAPSNGPTKAKFDRNKYQRELMRKRRKPKV